MNIERGIELLNQLPLPFLTALDHDRYYAIALGIEALKRLNEGRSRGYDYSGHRLPGETEN